jgi:hypothetical protein
MVEIQLLERLADFERGGGEGDTGESYCGDEAFHGLLL